ncbi:MAG: glycosyltransferase family 2 protein [Solirubrobacterales bacterium]
MSAKPPMIAVVIASRDRDDRLAAALTALDRQSLERDSFELIVVRSGSALAGGVLESRPGTTLIEHTGPPGAAAQRNIGWRLARAAQIAFLDDDSRPAPEWLERLLSAAGEATVVQGRIEPDPEQRHLLYGFARSAEITAQSPRFEAGNIVYPRALLESLDGFDESFEGSAWGEDTDLGLRAVAAGARTRYVDDAVVLHAVIPRTLVSAIRETARQDGLFRLLARHPAHRRALYPAGFVKPTHATLLLALVSLAVLRRPSALVFSLPHLSYHLRNHLAASSARPSQLARFALHLPGVLVLDLAELAVTVRAAIRHRVPLL